MPVGGRYLGLVAVAVAAVACTQAPSDDTVTSTAGVETTMTTASITASSSPTTTPGLAPTTIPPDHLAIEAFPVPPGSRPHDVAPAHGCGVWYTAQNLGELGWLNPDTGETVHISLGSGSRPHGVIVDESGTAWITDSGLNAIVSVDPTTHEVTVYPLPDDRSDSNLNTAAFDDDGILWFTGQAGVYGSLDPATGSMKVYDAPNGRGPYGITATPSGVVYFASLAGSYVGEIGADGLVLVIQPPTAGQGARRVWSDSLGNVWVSEWNTGNLSRYTPSTGEWGAWPLPGDHPATYAVYVDEDDVVWASDFGSNSIVRFDPGTEEFTVLTLPHQSGEVRQLQGRPGEVWGAESAADHLVLIRTTP